MAAPPPIPCVFDGEAFRPLPNFLRVAREHYGAGEVTSMVRQDERSELSHRHEFAWLKEAWANLPDAVSGEYPSPEHLRKRALIATGWCDVTDYPCVFKTEARRMAERLRSELDDYSVVIVSENVVRVCRAKSQARGKMTREDFQASKNAILEWVAALLDVAPADLERAQAA